jgi:hypothetical protein
MVFRNLESDLIYTVTNESDYYLSIPFKKLKIYRDLFISPVVFSAFFHLDIKGRLVEQSFLIFKVTAGNNNL